MTAERAEKLPASKLTASVAVNHAAGHVAASWAYQPAVGTEKFSLVTENGSLTSDGTSLIIRMRGGEPETRTFDPVHEFEAEIGHFADCVLHGRRPIQTHCEGIDVLGVILAAYRSAESGAIARVGAAGPNTRR